MLSQAHRLKANKDFRLIHARGGKFVGSSFFARALQPKPRAAEATPSRPARFGFSASERVGKAVIRNRAKRRLREAVRACMKQMPEGWDTFRDWDFVISARESAASAPFEDLVGEMSQALGYLCRSDKRGEARGAAGRARVRR